MIYFLIFINLYVVQSLISSPNKFYTATINATQICITKLLANTICENFNNTLEKILLSNEGILYIPETNYTLNLFNSTNFININSELINFDFSIEFTANPTLRPSVSPSVSSSVRPTYIDGEIISSNVLSLRIVNGYSYFKNDKNPINITISDTYGDTTLSSQTLDQSSYTMVRGKNIIVIGNPLNFQVIALMSNKKITISSNSLLFGVYCEIVKDFDGDGIDDFLVSSTLINTVYLIRSTTIVNLYQPIDIENLNVTKFSPQSGERNFGRALASYEDNIYISSLNNYNGGIIYQFNLNGTLIRRIVTENWNQLGMTIAPTKDDIMVGGVDHLNSYQNYVYAINSKTKIYGSSLVQSYLGTISILNSDIRKPYISIINTPSTITPTIKPSLNPTLNPSLKPSLYPTPNPSTNPTIKPTSIFFISDSPTEFPTNSPTYNPTNEPTNTPSYQSTSIPTNGPTYMTSNGPTSVTSNGPTSIIQDQSKIPTPNPTQIPTPNPTQIPTQKPTPYKHIYFVPTLRPSETPSSRPSSYPTMISSEKNSKFVTIISTSIAAGIFISILYIVFKNRPSKVEDINILNPIVLTIVTNVERKSESSYDSDDSSHYPSPDISSHDYSQLDSSNDDHFRLDSSDNSEFV